MTNESRRVQEDISPNLIPMIDIMFLLLLFFMLGADMGHREIEDVRPPKAETAKAPPPGAQRERLTVNVFHRDARDMACAAYAGQRVCRDASHWRVGVHGRDSTAPEQLAAVLKQEADLARTDPQHPKSSERAVSVRADAASPYGLVQGVMTACAQVGIYKIECAARAATDNR